MSLLAEHFDNPCSLKCPITTREVVQLWFSAIRMETNCSSFFYHSLSNEHKEVQIKIHSIRKEHVPFPTVVKPFPLIKKGSLSNYFFHEIKSRRMFLILNQHLYAFEVEKAPQTSQRRKCVECHQIIFSHPVF